MNRIDQRIKDVKRKKQKIFCAYITLGYPDLGTTSSLVEKFCRQGVDMIEWGFPFSDPLADGPTIQHASEEALKNHVSIEDAFAASFRLRGKGIETPFIFFTYFNPVFYYGIKKFAERAAKAGFDGVIIPDLPPDMEESVQREFKKAGLQSIFLIAPTTKAERARQIARASEGFIYYVSLKGVTGAQDALPSEIKKHLKELRALTTKPVLIGFGVSKPDQARELSRFSDGVIVGSAIINQIKNARGNEAPVIHFVQEMLDAVHSS